MEEPPSISFEKRKQYEVSTPRMAEKAAAAELDIQTSQLQYIPG